MGFSGSITPLHRGLPILTTTGGEISSQRELRIIGLRVKECPLVGESVSMADGVRLGLIVLFILKDGLSHRD